MAAPKGKRLPLRNAQTARFDRGKTAYIRHEFNTLG
jgi:hypothetical protein